MKFTRSRVLGALVAVVLAASGVVGLASHASSTAATSSVVDRQALTTDVVLSTETLRGDKVEARRFLAEHFGLAPAATTHAGAAEPSLRIISSRVVRDTTPPPGLSFGRAPPSFR